MNALAREWSDGKSWCHPPIELIGQAIAQIRENRTQATLLVPFWPSAWWWLRLCPDGRNFGHWVFGYLRASSRTALVLGEGLMPRSMESGCDILVLDQNGQKHNGAQYGPIAGFCSLGGCDICDGYGSWL